MSTFSPHKNEFPQTMHMVKITSPLCENTSLYSQTLSLLADSSVNNVCCIFNLSLFEFVHVIDATLIHDTLLIDAPNLVVIWVHFSRMFGGDEVGGFAAAEWLAQIALITVFLNDWLVHCSAGR